MNDLIEKLKDKFGQDRLTCAFEQWTLILDKKDILSSAKILRDDFVFDTLIDLCGVDYLVFGQAEWKVNASSSGFGRAKFDINDQPNNIQLAQSTNSHHPERFSVVYHLLSVANNQRLRVKIYVPEEDLFIDSVVSVWASADWYEREAFDLFGLLFEGHEDLRRILTDYGFVGHPLRKDFPMIGEVEMRYDNTLGKVIYEPVSIEPHVNVPKVIRE